MRPAVAKPPIFVAHVHSALSNGAPCCNISHDSIAATHRYLDAQTTMRQRKIALRHRRFVVFITCIKSATHTQITPMQSAKLPDSTPTRPQTRATHSDAKNSAEIDKKSSSEEPTEPPSKFDCDRCQFRHASRAVQFQLAYFQYKILSITLSTSSRRTSNDKRESRTLSLRALSATVQNIDTACVACEKCA